MAVGSTVSVTQMYATMRSMHGGGDVPVLTGYPGTATNATLPSIHPVLHRGTFVRKSTGNSTGNRGGVKVIQQPLGGSFVRGKSTSTTSTDSTTRHDSSMTPTAAIARFKRIMSEYELTEIKGYDKIWFVGPTAQKIRGTKNDRNFGFDNEKARYRVVKNDHVAYRYEVLKCLGKGSFGDVMQVYDHKLKEFVALKIIRNEPRFHDQAKEEIKILQLLLEKDAANRHNVVHMKDYFKFRGHLCITFELCHNDLYAELKLGRFAGFSLESVKSVGRELVQSLRHLRRNKIIHCDLKPENILLRKAGSSALKIIDFGSSCFVKDQVHTYIQSRFYRAPEIILGVLPYGCPIDMWSLGCILVELYTGRPLFPGHNEREQLMYQIEYLGGPPESFLQKAERRRSFFVDGMKLKPTTDRRNRPRTLRARSLKMLVGSSQEHLEFLDFVMSCLQWDPNDRITPRDASRHPFLATRSSRSLPSTPPATESNTKVARRQSAPQPIPSVSSEIITGADNSPQEYQGAKRTYSSDAAIGQEAIVVAHERTTTTRRQSKIFFSATGVTTTGASLGNIGEATTTA